VLTGNGQRMGERLENIMPLLHIGDSRGTKMMTDKVLVGLCRQVFGVAGTWYKIQ